MAWTDALNMKSAGRSFQPSGNGAQRAGEAGYGGGNIPYAGGSQQFQPSSPYDQGPTATPAAPELPQGAGNGAAGAPTSEPPAPAAGGAPVDQAPQSQMIDPYMSLRYAKYLMDRFMNARQQGGGYRG